MDFGDSVASANQQTSLCAQPPIRTSSQPSSKTCQSEMTSEPQTINKLYIEEQDIGPDPGPWASDHAQPRSLLDQETLDSDLEPETERLDGVDNEPVSDEALPLIQDHIRAGSGSRYALKAYLSQFIPEVDPESERSSSAFRVWKSKQSTMLVIQQTMAYVIATANIAILIWAIRSHPPYRGIGTIFIGDCSTVNTMDTLMHLGLNALSTLFLGAGNWSLQILVAPSIEDICKAHRKGKSLDIGVPSIRNLFYIDRVRVCIWLVIGLTSSVLHLMWNSTFFSSIPIVLYTVVIATNDILTWPVPWNQSDSTINNLQTLAANFTKLDNLDCISYYQNYAQVTADVIIATNYTAASNDGSSFIASFTSPNPAYYCDNDNQWLCFGYPSHTAGRCLLPEIAPFAADWQIQIGTRNITAQYCLLSQRANNQSRCAIQFSVVIFVIVAVALALECVFLSLVAWRYRAVHAQANATDDEGIKSKKLSPATSLVTFGDAAAAFLQDPEDVTLDAKPESVEGEDSPSSIDSTFSIRKARWEGSSQPRWYRAARVRTWLVSIFLIVSTIGIGFFLFWDSLWTLQRHGAPTSLSRLWNDGDRIGGFTGYNVADSSLSVNQNLVAQVVGANSFQLIISFLYLFYNGLLTQQLVADEFIRFLVTKKPLRVSSPSTIVQRSTYALSLPYRYSVPLMAACILLHWFISRSLFVITTNVYGPGPNGARLPDLDASRLGSSVTGILAAALLGVIMLLALLLNSFRKYPASPLAMPLMATDSAGISAACHRPKGDIDAYLYPVRLAATDSGLGDSTKVVCFSTDIHADKPESGTVYWQPVAAMPRARKGYKGILKTVDKE